MPRDLSSAAEAALTEALRAFRGFGAATQEMERGGLRYFVNEYWTARQRQSHSIHEISYRACFKAQLPEFLIQRLTAPGEAVYDPFMGRGTTPVQAALMGRRPVGNDINPLSTMLTRPRLAPPGLAEIETRLRRIPWQVEGDGGSEDLLAFYHPATLGQILALRNWLLGRDAAGGLDPVDDWIRMVAINRLTGHSSGFFSVYTMPPNQAVSAATQRRINAARGQAPAPRDVPALILRKSRALLADGPVPPHPPALLGTGPAERTPHVETGSISLIVTSPPFLDVVNYAEDNWLRCWFAGIDIRQVRIAMHRKEEDWRNFIADCFAEFARVVRPGGHVAFEVGEVRGGRLLLENLVRDAVGTLPFAPLGVMVNDQRFTKTANCWGVRNNSKGTNTNRIVLFRREAR